MCPKGPTPWPQDRSPLVKLPIPLPQAGAYLVDPSRSVAEGRSQQAQMGQCLTWTPLGDPPRSILPKCCLMV